MSPIRTPTIQSSGRMKRAWTPDRVVRDDQELSRLPKTMVVAGQFADLGRIKRHVQGPDGIPLVLQRGLEHHQWRSSRVYL